MTSSPWKAYLAVFAPAALVYTVLPQDTWLQTGWTSALGLLSAWAIVAGMRRHRPAGPAAWYFCAAGLALNALGPLVEREMGLLNINTFPSVADVLYLALYPGVAIGLLMLIRLRTTGRDWGTLVDATTITTGLGLLSWVFFIHPAAGDASLGLLGHVASVAYPVGDVVLLAMLVRLALDAGSRNASFRLLAASLLLFLCGDTTWAIINQLGAEPGVLASDLLQMVFLAGFGLFGAAALHPTVRLLAEPAPPRRPRASKTLLALLAGASLIAPVLLGIEALQHKVTDGVAIAVGSVALFSLVVVRMAQLLRHVEAQAGQLLELARVDDLTGLSNRRAWSAELPRAIERARRYDEPLSIAMLDLDHFKRFNDALGHPAGDRLLKAASAAWRTCLRDADELARYGGEEFILLLPGARAEAAAEVVERLRSVTPAGQTFSAGIAVWDGTETSDELVQRADSALYEAKRSGRDRVVQAAA